MPHAVVFMSFILIVGLWRACGRLHEFGFEALAWNRSQPKWCWNALSLGVAAGLAVTGLFATNGPIRLPPQTGIWMGVAIGPLIEELVFRGYLYYGFHWLLRRSGWRDRMDWGAATAVSAIFAASHLVKDGITPLQVGVIFMTGLLFAWIRLKSGSTAPSYLAHVAYNGVIYGSAILGSVTRIQ